MFTNNPNLKINYKDLTDDATVSHTGGTNSQLLQPPAGKVWQVIYFRMSIPAPVGDTAGTHNMKISYYDGTVYHNIVEIVSNHSTSCESYYFQFQGTSSEAPANAGQQQEIVSRLLWASNSYPIRFIYTNDTDADQTGTRQLDIWVKEYTESA